MKSVVILVCIFAGTIELTSALCDYNKILSCSSTFSSALTQASGSVEKVCRVYNAFVSCVKGTPGCEDIKQKLNSLIAQYSTQLAPCDGYKEYPECRDKFQRCSAGFSTCDRLKRTKECLMDKQCENDPIVKTALAQVKANADRLRCDGSSPQCSDKAYQCSIFGVKPSQTGKSTREELCEYTQKSKECLMDKACENDPKVKQMLQEAKRRAIALQCVDGATSTTGNFLLCLLLALAIFVFRE